jgi:predicted RNA-binding protein YlxR (DUF448 family)
MTVMTAIIDTYVVETHPGRTVLMALCVACASREARPARHCGPQVGHPHNACESCRLGAAGPIQTLTVAQILDDLVAVVDRSRIALVARPEWREELDEAFDWLLRFEGQIVTDGHVVLLPSESEPGRSYSVNGACQCGAYAHRANERHDRACKHRVRAKLIKRALAYRAELLAAEAAALAQRLAEARYQRSLREINELFPS